jgi:hypothetical protein
VSVGHPGGDIDGAAWLNDITPTGRYVLFEYFHTAASGGCACWLAFLRDIVGGTTELINSGSGNSLSSDARYVLTHGLGPNNGLYLKDLFAGTPNELISYLPSGSPAGYGGIHGILSADARYFSWMNEQGVFVNDRQIGDMELVSGTDDGEPAPGGWHGGDVLAMSPNARFVVMELQSPTQVSTIVYKDIDPDGDGWLGSIDLCPNVSSGWLVGPGDSDCDGYADTVAVPPRAPESVIGTLPGVMCSTTPAANDELLPDAWPPDINDNQIVNGADILSFTIAFGQPTSNPPVTLLGTAIPVTRFDLNGSGLVNGADVLQLNPFFGKRCV